MFGGLQPIKGFHLMRHLQVELAHGGIRRGKRGTDRGPGYGGGYGGGISRRSEYRVKISNLPKTASWQDLKDHMRRGGEVTYAQVNSTSGLHPC